MGERPTKTVTHAVLNDLGMQGRMPDGSCTSAPVNERRMELHVNDEKTKLINAMQVMMEAIYLNSASNFRGLYHYVRVY